MKRKWNKDKARKFFQWEKSFEEWPTKWFELKTLEDFFHGFFFVSSLLALRY